MEKIKAFIEAGSCSGDGSGSCSGDGDSFGCGDGSGYGFDDGSGYGNGSGSLFSSRSGSDFSNGSGYGFGDCSGYGFGCGGNGADGGSGFGIGRAGSIKSYAGKDVYLLDGVQTIIAAVHRNTAVGYILGDDLTLRRCYIAKGNGYFAQKFFYDWHHRLTGSCEMGRKDFAMRNGIDLDTDSFTVREFINLTENAYGGEIIRKVKERLYENNA